MKTNKTRLNALDIQMNRRGKADGYLAEVRRGNGVHTPKKMKKKHTEKWKEDVKNFY